MMNRLSASNTNFPPLASVDEQLTATPPPHTRIPATPRSAVEISAKISAGWNFSSRKVGEILRDASCQHGMYRQCRQMRLESPLSGPGQGKKSQGDSQLPGPNQGLGGSGRGLRASHYQR